MTWICSWRSKTPVTRRGLNTVRSVPHQVKVVAQELTKLLWNRARFGAFKLFDALLLVRLYSFEGVSNHFGVLVCTSFFTNVTQNWIIICRLSSDNVQTLDLTSANSGAEAQTSTGPNGWFPSNFKSGTSILHTHTHGGTYTYNALYKIQYADHTHCNTYWYTHCLVTIEHT